MHRCRHHRLTKVCAELGNFDCATFAGGNGHKTANKQVLVYISYELAQCVKSGGLELPG